MQHRRAILIVLVVCGFATLITGAWHVLEGRAHQRATPPQGVASFESFLIWRDEIQRFEVLRPPSGEYLFVNAPGGRLFFGPSGYVFDRAGLLIDWSPDVNDDRAFQEKWEPFLRHDAEVMLEQARNWLNAGRGASTW